MTNRKTGVYLIGALGSISSTVVSGAIALRKKLTAPTGMITCSEMFDGTGLIDPGELLFCGCDIRREGTSRDIFEKMAPVHPRILMEIEEELEEFQRGIDTGCARNCGEAIEKLADQADPNGKPLAVEVEEMRENLRRFRRKFDLNEIVVVNLASTEPPVNLESCHSDPASLEACIAENLKEKVRASTLYAWAAVLEGTPYINFTPSNGALPPAVVQLARMHGVPVMGNDGKTGETLVKSALAPMFACRNLEILSWEGFNILGNMDGQVLNHPGNKESKIRTKDQVLSKILGYAPHTTVSIGYVPSLDDQKTAWDFIHFKGFLGAKMSLQFVWQGYDSLLAAPLVLDLVRLAELAKRRGEAGLMPHLASFFKAPIGVEKHALQDQFRLLAEYAEKLP
ncbi:MAG: inositol-3-phosphate synthase [Syntrophobacteraceae bacterium]